MVRSHLVPPKQIYAKRRRGAKKVYSQKSLWIIVGVFFISIILTALLLIILYKRSKDEYNQEIESGTVAPVINPNGLEKYYFNIEDEIIIPAPTAFDDGPSEYTGQLLDVLAEYGAKATFFITGSGDAINRIYRTPTMHHNIWN